MNPRERSAAVLGTETPGDVLLQAANNRLRRRTAKFDNEQSHGQPFAPCPPETRPLCRPQAAGYAYLNHLHDLFEEWLQWLNTRGERVPAEAVPYLLELGERHRVWRSAIFPILGNRGRWAALQHPALKWACEPVVAYRVTYDTVAESEALRAMQLGLHDSSPGLHALRQHSRLWTEAFADEFLVYLMAHLTRRPTFRDGGLRAVTSYVVPNSIPITKARALLDALAIPKPDSWRLATYNVRNTLSLRLRLYEAVTGERL